jgi:hypothetical protein
MQSDELGSRVYHRGRVKMGGIRSERRAILLGGMREGNVASACQTKDFKVKFSSRLDYRECREDVMNERIVPFSEAIILQYLLILSACFPRGHLMK